jgi:non-ribosomal peptide synthetase component F
MLDIDAGASQFDLTLVLEEKPDDGGLSGVIEYSTDLFEQATITRMAGHYSVLLESIAANLDQPIAMLAILPQSEREQLLVGWNQTSQQYPQGDCIQDLIEQQVECTPSSVAICNLHGELTYLELNQKANQLAHYLRKLGVGPEVRVGVCVERGLDMVVGLLAILKAGGVYVPLDPNYPADRLRYSMEDSQSPVLLTHRHVYPQLPEYSGKAICLDDEQEWRQIGLESAENPKNFVQPENLAYIIYTSGSTGRPKGVAIQHSSAVGLLYWARTYRCLKSLHR